MFRAEVFPGAMEQVADLLDRAITVAADEAAVVLYTRLGRGYMERTGRKYAKYPLPSSKPKEYPQEQYGVLQSKVDSKFVTSGEAQVGIFGENPKKLGMLEFGHPDTGKGQRPLVGHTMEDPETHKAMNQRVREAFE